LPHLLFHQKYIIIIIIIIRIIRIVRIRVII